MVNLLKIILVICSLILITFSQRGGGGSRSRSSSRRRSRSWGSTWGNDDQENCTTVKGKTKCTDSQDEQEGISAWTLLYVAGAGLFKLYEMYSSAQDEKKREAIIEAEMRQFATKFQSESESVSSDEKNKLVENFMNKKYTIKIYLRDQSQNFTCPVQVTQLTKMDQNKYKIFMNGSDSVGKSTFIGLVMFKPQGLRLKLSKTYSNRKKAGQTGKYHTLLYEGEGDVENIEGEWAFKGFQSSSKYSGNWNMRAKA